MKYSSKKLMDSIYRHIGNDVEETAFLGGRIFTGTRGSVTCYYPADEVFSSAAESGLIKTVYERFKPI